MEENPLIEPISSDYHMLFMMGNSEENIGNKQLLGVEHSLLSLHKQRLMTSSTKSLKVAFCITMYNESWKLMMNTFEGLL